MYIISIGYPEFAGLSNAYIYIYIQIYIYILNN